MALFILSAPMQRQTKNTSTAGRRSRGSEIRTLGKSGRLGFPARIGPAAGLSLAWATDEDRVGAAKRERVRHDRCQLHAGSGAVGHIVEVAFRVGQAEVDGRRNGLSLQSEHRRHKFQRTCSTEQDMFVIAQNTRQR